MAWLEDVDRDAGEARFSVQVFGRAHRQGCVGCGDGQGAAIDPAADALVGEFTQIASDRVLGCAEFACQIGGENAPFRIQADLNELVSLFGEERIVHKHAISCINVQNKVSKAGSANMCDRISLSVQRSCALQKIFGIKSIKIIDR